MRQEPLWFKLRACHLKCAEVSRSAPGTGARLTSRPLWRLWRVCQCRSSAPHPDWRFVPIRHRSPCVFVADDGDELLAMGARAASCRQNRRRADDGWGTAPPLAPSMSRRQRDKAISTLTTANSPPPTAEGRLLLQPPSPPPATDDDDADDDDDDDDAYATTPPPRKYCRSETATGSIEIGSSRCC